MQSEIIPIDRASRPMASRIDDHTSVVERLHDELARVMELRRRTEQELQAIRARAIAQDKLAALGQLAACAAHEMNQPLFFLKIFCESIVKDGGVQPSDSPAFCDEAKEACRQIERIQKINRQILRYSRPEPESFAPQEVPPALERALVLMNPQLKRYGVKLSERRDAALTPIMGNSGKLEQLFINLLQNAIDAQTNQGEKKILIRFIQQKRNLVIIFRDNGPGIPEAIREKIFEPFFTTKIAGQGTGLGLAIAVDIVRAHQGTIQLNHKKKRGAEFTIKLPLVLDYADRRLQAGNIGRQNGLTEPGDSVSTGNKILSK